MQRVLFPAISTVLLALVLLSLPGCVARETLPTITPDAGHLRLSGKFVWFDLHTPDMAGARKFYDRVFNWSLERSDEDSGKVKTILLGDMRIGSIFEVEVPPDGASWLSCMSVPDADQAFERAKDEGASGEPPANMPYRGRMAEIRDPQGAAVALLTSSVGDPRDRPLKDGYWLGAELWTGDVESAATFYVHLAGLEQASMNQPDGGLYVMLVGDRRPRGGVTAIPLEGQGPQWVPQVAVLDLQATLERVEEYGGTVLIRPGMPGAVEGTAVFADPQGAVLGIREFIPPED